ncbi:MULTISPECIES: MFS transporter [unclassified Burkholderia]|uniref:MFS transporter n=1 Tax=unclassified Burkholderia TaxID=2613784 RepID=UPI000756F039|nr:MULTISPECIES: MFS transporter [unclassified Burkholderia]AOI76267.1 MFS transporter [Burkholderia sp. NRF60-BP8]KVA14695.1 MFS transporter [Burkholderia sp. NRF60-BP8]KVL19544.1 MFS transporter [Burkholderia sp. MSMB1826]
MSTLNRAAAAQTIDERRAMRRTVAAAALGNGLEFFDFTVYSFFAVLIGRLFFPASSDAGALMLSLATFGVGFVARPLGSVAIGAYADRVGRKPALVLTVALMALGTGIIGFAPTYAQIGIAAPLLIVIGRLLQGFSAGGEVGAATTLLMESGGARRRGELVSWQMASQGGAALAGALVALTLSRWLPPDALQGWGWRVPFVLGLLIGPVGFYLRRHLDDTLPHPAAGAPRVSRRIPWRQVAAGTLLVIGGTSTMYTIVFFLPSFLTLTLGMPASVSLLSGCTAGAVMLAGSPFAGRFADRLRRRKPMLQTVCAISTALVLPAFHAMRAWPSVFTVLAVVVVLIGLMTLSSPAGFVMILEALRPEVRATSLGMIYALGVTIFGGFAQLIVSALWRATGSFYAPAWYVLGGGVASFVGLALFREETAR